MVVNCIIFVVEKGIIGDIRGGKKRDINVPATQFDRMNEVPRNCGFLTDIITGINY